LFVISTFLICNLAKKELKNGLVNYDAALACKGRYYLPYQPWATVEQCQQAYPELDIFRAIKKKYDPHNYFLNSFTSKYIAI
jgi:FAD/FMN-containing dehydrogenase